MIEKQACRTERKPILIYGSCPNRKEFLLLIEIEPTAHFFTLSILINLHYETFCF